MSRAELPSFLVDAGDGRRLERFAERLVDRPAPGAGEPRLTPAAWAGADLRFDRVTGWTGDERAWTLAVAGLTLELRPTASGQVGFYPEHTVFWPWLRARVAARTAPEILHLFAATGATTLHLAGEGAHVTHVDGSRPTVGWARRNARLSGLDERPIRWIVDDALAFARREARRRRRYDGIVLDPPSFGHGPGGGRWQLDQALPDLLAACAGVAAPDAFVLLTAHTTGLRADDVGRALGEAFRRKRAAVEASDVVLVAESGASLPLGVAARIMT